MSISWASRYVAVTELTFALIRMVFFVAVAEQGTYSPIVFAAAGVSLLVLGLFPGLVQEFTEMVAGPASEIFGG
ncbi:MAG: hypothetical protein JRN30_07010, partial [Nitrososphaerota archaeon]|nr:hypothetical protein [Nitrososphaerota archaeon]